GRPTDTTSHLRRDGGRSLWLLSDSPRHRLLETPPSGSRGGQSDRVRLVRARRCSFRHARAIATVQQPIARVMSWKESKLKVRGGAVDHLGEPVGSRSSSFRMTLAACSARACEPSRVKWTSRGRCNLGCFFTSFQWSSIGIFSSPITRLAASL